MTTITETGSELEKMLTNKHLNQALLDSLPYPAAIIRRDRVILAANKIAKEIGAKVGTQCWDTLGNKASISDKDREYYEAHKELPAGGIKCIFCLCNSALSQGILMNKEVNVGDLRFDTFWVPLDKDIILHYFIEIKS